MKTQNLVDFTDLQSSMKRFSPYVFFNKKENLPHHSKQNFTWNHLENMLAKCKMF